jgi:hypothetical protein
MSDDIKKTTTSQWKGTEKKAASFVGTDRNPFSGSTGGLSASDSIHDRLFLECKTKQKHSVKTLYDDTKVLADNEGKIPVLLLNETGSKDVLWVIEQKDVAKLLREVDLNKVDSRIKEGTTIYDLVSQQDTSNEDIYTVKKNLTNRLQEIFRAKVLSNEITMEIRSIAVLLESINMIEDYMADGVEK